MAKLYGSDLERAKLAQTVIAKGELIKPSPVFIGDGSADARKLYALEEKRGECIRECATQWAKVTNTDKKLFWKRSLPQTLFDTLESYDMAVAILAAEAFLERKGYEIVRPKFEEVSVTTDERAKYLRKMGFRVGARDMRINTDFPGKFMVCEDYEESELPTRDGASGPWCIVGDDLASLIDEAFNLWKNRGSY